MSTRLPSFVNTETSRYGTASPPAMLCCIGQPYSQTDAPTRSSECNTSRQGRPITSPAPQPHMRSSAGLIERIRRSRSTSMMPSVVFWMIASSRRFSSATRWCAFALSIATDA